MIADQRETKSLQQALGRTVSPYKRKKQPRSFLARLDLKPGEKRKYVSPKKFNDVQLMGGRVNGKGGLMTSAEQAGNGYNFYQRGVVVKVRQRPGGRVKIVAINTSPRKARVGVRYKRG
jgi:hypothetical protein